MPTWIAALIAFVALMIVPAEASKTKPKAPVFDSPEAIQRWINGYRAKPEPKRLTAAVKAMVQLGVLRETDNAGVARFLQRNIEVLLHKPFADESLAIIDAEFARSGNALSTVEERITSTTDEIILGYWDLMAPFILTMPPGAMERPLGVYSTFVPARSAQLSVNGEAASAKVFLIDRFGKPASSCCLAWSESWVRPPG